MMRAKTCALALATLLAAVTASFCTNPAAPAAGKPAAISGELLSFVSTHCVNCHDDTTRKGAVSFELHGDLVTDTTAAGWLRALEQIERGTMPPPDKDQPEASKRNAAALALEGALASHAQSKPARETAVLRRLNRTEYRRTLEDLLHLDLSGHDPTRDFPDDVRSHGFDTLIFENREGFGVHELVSCQRTCIEHKLNGSCVPELRTGWGASLPCSCNGSLPVVNCALTGVDQVGPWPAIRHHYAGGFQAPLNVGRWFPRWPVMPTVRLPMCKHG